jgi:hypothetical protein
MILHLSHDRQHHLLKCKINFDLLFDLLLIHSSHSMMNMTISVERTFLTLSIDLLLVIPYSSHDGHDYLHGVNCGETQIDRKCISILALL